MRSLRNALAMAIPIAGTVLVLLAVLLPSIMANQPLQITLVIVGLVLCQVGTWRLAARVLPNQRKYLALRAEVESFLSFIRVLNAQAIKLREEDSETRRNAYRESIDALHLAADRIAEVAGRED